MEQTTLAAPLTIEQIAAERAATQSQLDQAKKRERLLKHWSLAVASLFLLLVITHIMGAQLLAVVVVAFAFAFAFVAVAVLLERFKFATATATYRLEELSDLDASAGDHCVQYLAWCESDSQLSKYQKKIAQYGRKPIVRDFRAAKSWIDNIEAQQQADRQSDACKRLAAWAD